MGQLVALAVTRLVSFPLAFSFVANRSAKRHNRACKKCRTVTWRHVDLVNLVVRANVESLTVHIQNLESRDGSTREAAAQALYNLGPRARPSVPALLDALLSEPDNCPWVGTAIVELQPTVSDIPKLRDALHSANQHVRFWAARAIVKLGPEGFPLVPDLIGLLCDPNDPVTDSVAWALGSIGREAVMPLIDAANADDSQLQSRAILALGRYPEHIKAKLPTIVNALDADDRDVRNCAARAICSLAQSAHPDTTIYDEASVATLVDTIERIVGDSSIEVEPDWPQRILGWLKDSA